MNLIKWIFHHEPDEDIKRIANQNAEAKRLFLHKAGRAETAFDQLAKDLRNVK